MLSLRSATPPTWVRAVESSLPEVLVDHAHCEKKAAGTAMSMVFAYVEHVPFVTRLADIVKEELDHFQQVLALLEARGIPFSGQPQSAYGNRLAQHIGRKEPARVVDRCLVAALIEARSCERFTLLRDHLHDAELAAFYGRLLESEARHFATYIGLAKHFAPAEVVDARLDELSAIESEILASPAERTRLHS